jgi:DNA primase
VNVFETLREQVAIGRLIEPGNGGKAHCVASEHEDNNPSMHFYDDHVHCFACGFHGDVTDVWAAMHGFDKPVEAALDLAGEFGIELPQANPEACQKARERRDKEDLYLVQAKACHETLSGHPRVTEWWEARGFGQELRERFLLGTNKDGTAAVIPFWHRGRVQGLIRRKLEGAPRYLYPKAEEFPGGYRPLFIPASVRSDAFLTEGIVDALALAAIGEGAIAVGGTGMSRKQLRELDAVPGPLYIVPDADEEGEQAAREWARKLYPKALVCPAQYEGEAAAVRKDFADVFAEQGETAREVLGRLRERAVDALHLELSEAPKGSNSLGAYRVAKERVLPLLLKLEDEGERDAALHDVADTLKLNIKPLRKTLVAMLEEQRGSQEEQAEAAGDGAPEPGSARHERAMKVLRDRRLLSRAAVAMKRLGHVGEFAAKKLAFICAVSGRSGKPIQPSTHAQSAAGKNFLWDTALSLLPQEMVVKRSGLSAKALFRTQTNLKGAVLYIQEVAGSEDAEYTIRVMQSDGRLEYEATETMPDGGMKNVVYQTEGPTVVVQITTKNHLHPENETRVFPIYLDESEAQTARIVGSILKEASGLASNEAERARIQQRWQDAIRLLEPAEVAIPYADRIVIPNTPLRIRRDARRLIDVVRVIAWLYQYQRQRDAEGRILATEGDFHEALALVSESLRRAWQTLTPAEEKVLEAIRQLPETQRTRNGFKRRELKVKEVSDRRVKEVLKSLTDTGYLDSDGSRGPQGYTYTLVRDADEISLGISLRSPPDKDELPIDKPDTNGRKRLARYRPSPNGGEEGETCREVGESGRNSHRPIETADLQGKYATGRAGGGKRVENFTANWSSGRRFTEEEERRVRKLVKVGMSETWARRTVLASDHSLGCDCEVCL